MGIYSALSARGQMFQAFPLGGPIKRFDVGAAWTELPLAQRCDLFKLRVPAGATVIFAHSNGIPGLAAEDEVNEEHLGSSDVLDPGVHIYSSNRRSTVKFFVAAPDLDEGETLELILTEAASEA